MDTFKIAKYVLIDILRNRFVLAYTALLLLVSMSFFNLENDANKGIMSLLNIVLIVLPMVSIIFSTIHIYNANEFMELMLAQPIRRSAILLGQYTGIAGSLCLAWLVGAGVPILLYDSSSRGLVLIVIGLVLTLVFVSMALLATVLSRDKAKGIGIALVLWFYFSILYDGLVLMSMFAFSEYPLENVVLGLTFLNPVDLARIAMLMQLDAAALMGYTGAMFQQFFGSGLGVALSFLAMLAWAIFPLLISLRIFRHKDI
ncbi:MAG: ABC transporter permease subunit [Lewinellaceae bacterium]|nr:ABC transporter permease subunit [Lewinellaceae bacterium]